MLCAWRTRTGQGRMRQARACTVARVQHHLPSSLGRKREKVISKQIGRCKGCGCGAETRMSMNLAKVAHSPHSLQLSCLDFKHGHGFILIINLHQFPAGFRCRRAMRSPRCAPSASRPPGRSWAMPCGPCTGGCTVGEFR